MPCSGARSATRLSSLVCRDPVDCRDALPVDRAVVGDQPDALAAQGSRQVGEKDVQTWQHRRRRLPHRDGAWPCGRLNRRRGHGRPLRASGGEHENQRRARVETIAASRARTIAVSTAADKRPRVQQTRRQDRGSRHRALVCDVQRSTFGSFLIGSRRRLVDGLACHVTSARSDDFDGSRHLITEELKAGEETALAVRHVRCKKLTRGVSGGDMVDASRASSSDPVVARLLRSQRVWGCACWNSVSSCGSARLSVPRLSCLRRLP